MKARLGEDYTVVFSVVTANALVAGIAPGDFTVQVLDPGGVNSGVAVVEETDVAGGTYRFTIPGAFLDAEGTYVTTITVAAPNAQVQTHFIDVEDDTTGVQSSVTWDAANNLIVVNSWLNDAEGEPLIDVEDCTVILLSSAGATLVGPEVVAAPLANGAFEVELAAPVFAVGEHATILQVSITRTDGLTYTGLTGVTFSRTV